jgi:geranylgeranyl pyrophosphate synthase
VEAGLARIRASRVLAAVGERARTHVAAAVEELGRLPLSPYRAALDELARTLADRRS